MVFPDTLFHQPLELSADAACGFFSVPAEASYLLSGCSSPSGKFEGEPITLGQTRESGCEVIGGKNRRAADAFKEQSADRSSKRHSRVVLRSRRLRERTV